MPRSSSLRLARLERALQDSCLGPRLKSEPTFDYNSRSGESHGRGYDTGLGFENRATPQDAKIRSRRISKSVLVAKIIECHAPKLLSSCALNPLFPHLAPIRHSNLTRLTGNSTAPKPSPPNNPLNSSSMPPMFLQSTPLQSQNQVVRPFLIPLSPLGPPLPCRHLAHDVRCRCRCRRHRRVGRRRRLFAMGRGEIPQGQGEGGGKSPAACRREAEAFLQAAYLSWQLRLA